MGSARQTLLVPTADPAPEVATVTHPSSTLSVSNGEDRSLHLSPTRADVLVPSTTGSSKKEAAADEHTAALLDGIDSLLSALSSDEDDDEFSEGTQSASDIQLPPMMTPDTMAGGILLIDAIGKEARIEFMTGKFSVIVILRALE